MIVKYGYSCVVGGICISVWVDFNFDLSKLVYIFNIIYISVWVDFNLAFCGIVMELTGIYISVWVDFNATVAA